MPGGQAGLCGALRGLVGPGAAVLVEVPTYLGALVAARSAGLRPVPVPTDAGGLRPDLLAEAFDRTGARLLYTQPTYANPTGAVLAPERRQVVLDVVPDRCKRPQSSYSAPRLDPPPELATSGTS